VCLLFIYNPIYSVINLILAYISAACTLIIWEVHFLAVVFILVYLGAVVVLFLFIVMMLNIKILSGFQILKGIPYLLFIVACIALCFIVYSGVKSASTNSLPLNFSILKTHEEMFKLNYVAYSAILFLDIVNQYTIQENFLISTLTADYKFSSNLAHVLYSFFGLELLYGALVLLIAMLGCIAVTFLIGQRLTQKQLYMDQLLQSSFLFLRG
jgi:NADH:ubiquinone oxidoreductase subunit 6 (subunit J)